MPQTSRTFRIFVSSTFSDLVAERNALQERVFPRLRELCQQHGCRFQAIDLRWGVSNEASLDQQAMTICLGEIARCQQASPRPNFIVLLGDRYGWRPPPAQIPATEFAGILGVIENGEDAALLQEWYSLDENAAPPEWRLQPRRRDGAYAKYENWQPVESRLHTILAQAVGNLNFTAERRSPYTASATEQEIAAGALRVKEAPEHVLCFFRSIDGLPQHFNLAAKDFLDLDEPAQAVDEQAHGRQESLKERLAAYVPGNVHHYQAQWTGDGITTDHIDKLCEDVYSALERIILDEINHPHEVAPAEKVVVHIRPDEKLDAEGLAHHTFAEERLRFFVGRTEMLANIADYLSDSGCRSLAIVGAGGSGKSALLARAIQQSQQSHPQAEIVYRFIGATPGSSDGRSLLESLCREISRRYGQSDADVPIDYRELVSELGKRMQLASAARPLVLFLDSLDQLSSSQGARSLIWLPSELPEHVSVIASTRLEDTLNALRVKRALEKELGGLSRREGDDLLSQWLTSFHRTLQEPQRREVLDKFEQSQGNPLYLKLAFEEARLWISGSGRPPEQLAPEVKGIIEKNTIDRLQHEGSHGEVLVANALGYLAASRYGLAEDELLDLLSRDLQVYAWFIKQSFHLPADLVRWAIQYRRSHTMGEAEGLGEPHKGEERAAMAWLKEIRNSSEQLTDFLSAVLPQADGPRLPVVLWSRLSFDLAPYLTERMVDGSPLLNFYHRELGDVSRDVFLAGDKDQPYHARLADYFRFKADPAGDRSWTGNDRHGLSELPYHLTHSERWEEVSSTLTDFGFIKEKCAAGMIDDLIRDYLDAIDRMRSLTEPRAQLNALVAYLRFIQAKSHILMRDAGSALQIAANFRQEASVCEAAVAALSSASEPTPWLRCLNDYQRDPFRQRLQTSITRGIAGLWADDKRNLLIVAASNGCLEAWDLMIGKRIAEAKIAIENDSLRLVTGSIRGLVFIFTQNGRMYTWNHVTNDLMLVLEMDLVGPTTAHLACDDELLFVGSEHGEILIYDLTHVSTVQRIRVGKEYWVKQITYSPERQVVVYCDEYGYGQFNYQREASCQARKLERHDGVASISGDRFLAYQAVYDGDWPGWTSIRDLSPGSTMADVYVRYRYNTAFLYPSLDSLVTINYDGDLSIYSVTPSNDEPICTFDFFKCRGVFALPGSNELLIYSWDSVVYVLDVSYCLKNAFDIGTRSHVKHSSEVQHISMASDGSRAISHANKFLGLWLPERGRMVHYEGRGESRESKVVISTDGALIAQSMRFDTICVYLWGYNGDELLHDRIKGPDRAYALALLDHDFLVVLSPWWAHLTMFDLTTREVVRDEPLLPEYRVSCAQLSQDGKWYTAIIYKKSDEYSHSHFLAFGSVSDPSHAERVAAIGDAGKNASLDRPTDMTISLEANKVALRDDCTTLVWDTQVDKIQQFTYEASVMSLALSADGSRLVLGLEDGRFGIVDSSTGAWLVSSFHDSAVIACACDRGGNLVAIGDEDGNVLFYRVSNHSAGSVKTRTD
jgi:WD40 repeat protein